MTTTQRSAQITIKLLRHAVENGFNVMLRGRHGCAKTAIVKSVLEEMGLNWKYFSTPTIDTYVDLVGIPYKGENGLMELLRPAALDFDNVEVIFLDEYNRSKPKVRNAILELIQFRSINGKKFPKLKVIIAAVNPDDDKDFSYDVEKLDGAQLGRFEVKISVTNNPCSIYFKKTYNNIGVLACKWWSEQTKEIKDWVNPRCLEAVVRMHIAGGDVQYVFDNNKVNTAEFASYVDQQDPSESLDEMCGVASDGTPIHTDEEKRKFLRDSNTYKHVQPDLLSKTRYLEALTHCIPEMVLMKELRSNEDSRLITHIVTHIESFQNLMDPVLNNKTSYNDRLVTELEAFQKKNNIVSSGRTVTILGVETSMSNMVVCISGTIPGYNRSQAQDLIRSYGAQVADRVNFKVTHLITDGKPREKLRRAKEQGCILIPTNEFLVMIDKLTAPPVQQSSTMRIINGNLQDINTLSLSNYADRVGKQFRRTNQELYDAISREDALKNMIEELRVHGTI